MNRHAQGGFTLLEILAAIVLAVIGFSIVLSAMGQASRHLAADRQMTQMALLARSLFDERASGRMTRGRWQGVQAGIHWTLSSSPVPSGPQLELYRLELLLDSQGQQQRFSSLRVQNHEQARQP
jgi:general secretion pathway protein I